MNQDSSWRAVAEALAAEVESLAPGARIPTHRQLVARFGASATTVSRALAELTRRGLVESRPGAGSFRTSTARTIPSLDTGWQDAALALTPAVGSDPTPQREHDATSLSTAIGSYGADVIDLNGGYLHPDLQPRDLLAKALARVGRRAEAWERPEAAGLPELRDWFATDIGAGLARHDLLIASGGQAAISLAMRAIGRPGDPVVVETPTFPGILAAARAAGLRPVTVPVDARGMRPEHLERALRQTGARLVVVQPAFQNPTGATMDAERQQELVDLAVRHGAFLLEDDFARSLAGPDAKLPPPMVSIDPVGAVIHVRSITKPTSPNLRVAAVAGRGPVMTRLRAAHVVDTMFVPAVLQHTALEVVASPAWPRALRRLSAELEHRREAAATAVRRHLGPDALADVPRGGYHLWVRLPPGLEDRPVAEQALQHGVAVTPGSSYQATRDATDHVRISYVGAPSSADVAAGVERLGRSTSIPVARSPHSTS
ncbi:MAG TPA: PLP-dependent aminotransferase family protein [Nocardioides sp.]|nr:PLP-dependent aminotransferase family protein [Nocardioides sp.]